MPTNIFTPNMPASGQSLGFTRPKVLGNFANYQENLEINHMNINSADFGKHKFLQIPTITSQVPPVPVPTTSANESALYTKVSGGESQVFVRQQSNGREFGRAVISGSVVGTVIGNGNILKNFAGYPDCYGILQAMINTNLTDVRTMVGIHIAGGTYDVYFFDPQSQGTKASVLNFVLSTLHINLGLGAPVGATLNWTFTHTIFA